MASTLASLGDHAMRVGPGQGDVIAHHPAVAPAFTGYDAGVLMYAHAWVMVGDTIIDDTACDAALKLAKLDAADGRKSQCLWAPDILIANRKRGVSFEQVRDGYGYAFYYEEISSYTRAAELIRAEFLGEVAA